MVGGVVGGGGGGGILTLCKGSCLPFPLVWGLFIVQNTPHFCGALILSV
jgi:hypothetical protein